MSKLTRGTNDLPTTCASSFNKKQKKNGGCREFSMENETKWFYDVLKEELGA